MKQDDNKRCIHNGIDSTTAERHEAEQTGEHLDQTRRINEATPVHLPTSEVPDDVAQPVIVWRELMLQQ